MQENRIVWIDVWKGMLIFLVVLGHVAGGLHLYTRGDAAFAVRLVFKFVYLFHMPAFFFLAGWVKGMSARDDNVAFGEFVRKKATRLLVPYVVWGILCIVVFMSLLTCSHLIQNGSDGYYNGVMFEFPWYRPFLSLLHGGGWPNGEGLRFNGVLWFLPCMFLVLVVNRMVVNRMIKTFRLGCAKMVVFTLVVALIGGVVQTNVNITLPWCLNRMLNLLAYLMFGRLLAGVKWLGGLHRRPLCVILGWASLVVAAGHVPHIYYFRTHFTWHVYSFLLGLAGCVLSMATARMVAESKWRTFVAIGAKAGGASLGIMLSHKFFIIPMQIGYPIIANWNWSFALCMAIGISVAVTLAAFCITCRIRRYMPIVVGESKRIL